MLVNYSSHAGLPQRSTNLFEKKNTLLKTEAAVKFDEEERLSLEKYYVSSGSIG